MTRGGGLALAVAACTPNPSPPPEPDLATSITVTFPNAGSSHPLLLYSGMSGGACLAYVPFVGTPALVLPSVSWSNTCRTEIDIFTPGFGAYARILDPANSDDVTWISTAISTGWLAIPLPPLLPVDVTLWVVAGGVDLPKATAVRDEQVTHAAPILEQMGPGVTLSVRDAFLVPGDISPFCTDGVSIRSGPHFDAGRINVYFVPFYGNTEWGAYAYTCWPQGFQDIVFVSFANVKTPIIALAHEIGHVLGLIRPLPVDVGGHTNFGPQPPFDDLNLMWTGAADVGNVSIGQMFRMNYDALSWLNWPARPLNPAMRTCQGTWTTPLLCPELTMYVGGWP